MALSIVTDFTLQHNGQTLTSDNRRASAAFVMHGDATIEASTPLSPVDVDHYHQLAKSLNSPKEPVEPSAGFVLVGHGLSEASGPLSPADRKLYYKRQSFRSPRVSKEDLLPEE